MRHYQVDQYMNYKCLRREERERKGYEAYSNLGKETKIQMQETQIITKI